MERPVFQLRILGPTELLGPDNEAAESVVRQPKRLALLAYMALTTADGFRRRDKVVALFWPELDQSQARTYLRKALHGIHETLGAEVFASRGENEVRLDFAQLWCDAVALPQLTREGRCHDALALYRGDLLEGLFPDGVAQEFHEWLDTQRRVLREHAAAAAWECSRVEEERGDRKAAAVMARRALELLPDDEVGVRRLMELLDAHGDRAGALRVYAEWQSRLQAEYGVEPAPETRKLARKVQAARKGESHETPPTPHIITEQTVAPASPVPVAAVAEPRRSRTVAVLTASLLVLTLAAAGMLVWNPGGRVAPIPDQSVAVLPIRAIGAGQAVVEAERVAEELTSALSATAGLRVRSAVRAREMAGDGGDVDRLGRRLGVAYLVDGAVQHGSRLRVTLRLVRTADAMSVWAGTYDSDEGEPIAAAQRVAAEAAVAIAARLVSTATRDTVPR
jgi:DNA-binding SARP family transcriptional activator/TolB-like protein